MTDNITLTIGSATYTVATDDVSGAHYQRVLAYPAEKTVTVVTGTASSSGDNALIAAPGASTRIVVCWVVIQNESSTATTLILRDGTTSKIRVLGQNQGDGLSMVFPPDARWKLTANTALNLNLSGANSCGYTVGYYTEAT